MYRLFGEVDGKDGVQVAFGRKSGPFSEMSIADRLTATGGLHAKARTSSHAFTRAPRSARCPDAAEFVVQPRSPEGRPGSRSDRIQHEAPRRKICHRH